MARAKTKLVYGGKSNTRFTMFFEHEDLCDLTGVNCSLYEEAILRVGTLLVKSLEKRDSYERDHGDANLGIQKVLDHLREAPQV